MTTPIDDANNTVKAVDQFDHKSDQGARGAYQELMKEYNAYRDPNSNHTQQDINDYWHQVTQNLVSDGNLPDLALAWAAEGNGDFSNYVLKQNSPYPEYFTKNELNVFQKFADSPENGFDKLMAKTLSDNFDQLSGGADTVGLYQVNDKLNNQITDLAAGDQQQQCMNLIAPLLKDGGRLYKALDQAQDGKLDNQVIKDDLVRFVNTPDSHSPEDIATVSNILKGWDNDPVIKTLHDDTWFNNDMTPTALAKAAGLPADNVKTIDDLLGVYHERIWSVPQITDPVTQPQASDVGAGPVLEPDRNDPERHTPAYAPVSPDVKFAIRSQMIMDMGEKAIAHDSDTVQTVAARMLGLTNLDDARVANLVTEITTLNHGNVQVTSGEPIVDVNLLYTDEAGSKIMDDQLNIAIEQFNKENSPPVASPNSSNYEAKV